MLTTYNLLAIVMLLFGGSTYTCFYSCKCVERESFSIAVGCWSVRTACVVGANHIRCSHSLAVQIQ